MLESNAEWEFVWRRIQEDLEKLNLLQLQIVRRNVNDWIQYRKNPLVLTAPEYTHEEMGYHPPDAVAAYVKRTGADYQVASERYWYDVPRFRED